MERTEHSDKPDLQFEYDAMGNRIAKHVIHSEHTLSTFYVRDAEGNSMATYTKTNETELALEEQPIYGSSRLGVYRPTAEPGIMRGARTYEATNHLGNVLVTYTDRIILNDNYEYSVDVSTASDYYPFGMPMPSRTFTGNGYRFGFNGMESEDDLYGEKNAYDFGARIYDARLGRFLSVDPLYFDYPYMSSFCFAANIPIMLIDENGEGPFLESIDNKQDKLVFQVVLYPEPGMSAQDMREAVSRAYRSAENNDEFTVQAPIGENALNPQLLMIKNREA